MIRIPWPVTNSRSWQAQHRKGLRRFQTHRDPAQRLVESSTGWRWASSRRSRTEIADQSCKSLDATSDQPEAVLWFRQGARTGAYSRKRERPPR